MIRRLLCRLFGCRPVRADYSHLHNAWFTNTRCPRCRRAYSYEEQRAAVPIIITGAP